MVTDMNIYQGDILKIEGIRFPVLVVSKDFLNSSGEIIGCPIYKAGPPGTLHVRLTTDEHEGFVHCEKLKHLDLNARGYSKKGEICLRDRIVISDTIQGLFEYM